LVGQAASASAEPLNTAEQVGLGGVVASAILILATGEGGVSGSTGQTQTSSKGKSADLSLGSGVGPLPAGGAAGVAGAGSDSSSGGDIASVIYDLAPTICFPPTTTSTSSTS